MLALPPTIFFVRPGVRTEWRILLSVFIKSVIYCGLVVVSIKPVHTGFAFLELGLSNGTAQHLSQFICSPTSYCTYLDVGHINRRIVITINGGSRGAILVLVNIHGHGKCRVVGAPQLKVLVHTLYFVRSAVNVLRHIWLFVIVALVFHILCLLIHVPFDICCDRDVVRTDGFIGTLVVLVLKNGKHNHINVIAAREEVKTERYSQQACEDAAESPSPLHEQQPGATYYTTHRFGRIA